MKLASNLKEKKPLKTLLVSAVVSNLLFVGTQASAEVFTVQVKVTVVEKTCDIYGATLGSPVSVNFPDMIINQIDGNNYGKTDIIFNIACEDAADNPKLKIQFIGTGAGSKFDTGLLRTSESNLAIKIRNKNTQQTVKLNDWINFNYNSKPQLEAVAVPSGSGGINSGEFNATATLSVEYQ